jgi:hypothetical protein
MNYSVGPVPVPQRSNVTEAVMNANRRPLPEDLTALKEILSGIPADPQTASYCAATRTYIRFAPSCKRSRWCLGDHRYYGQACRCAGDHQAIPLAYAKRNRWDANTGGRLWRYRNERYVRPTRPKQARPAPQFFPIFPVVGRGSGCRRPRSRLRAPPMRDVPIPRPALGETSFEGDGRPQFDGTTKLSRGIGARSPRRLPSSSLNPLFARSGRERAAKRFSIR